ncbi:hypothetical protein [Actinopolyspora halophila]|uniref:hypothetical protein n=1 Tax=Actinopolyspora halophila TaxID=1850 RepID=UPI00035DB828|nr:hypothetical protein [Actinopolyspora halophila]
MNTWEFVLLGALLICGAVLVVCGALGWMGWMSVGSWARWTRANRDGGRNQVLFALVLTCNGALSLLPSRDSFPLSLSLFLFLFLIAGVLGCFALSILHRRRYGPRPAADSPYASKRLW